MTRRDLTAWRAVHRWTSLACTAFLLMLCATGLPLIFHDEIDAALAPAAPLPAIPSGVHPPSLDALVARALAGLTEVPLYLSFDTDRPVVNVTSAAAPDAPAAAMRIQSLDRRTGAALPPRGATATAWLLRLHSDLLLGEPGELFLGAVGVLFVAALVSGVVLYPPFTARRRFGTVRHARGGTTRRLDRHNLLGIVTLAWASVVGLTGTVNTLAGPITALWKRHELVTIADPRATPPPLAARASIDAAVARVLAAAPGTRVQFIAFPGTAYSSARHYAVYLQGATPLTARLLTPGFVDARTGRLDALRPMPAYMVALLLAQPLHFGDYAGWPMKVLWAALDLVTIAVLLTGLRLWLARRA